MTSEEERKELLCKVVDAAVKILFSEEKPSVEKLFEIIETEFGDISFCYCKENLKKALDDLPEKFPEQADAAMEFVLKHVLPLLAVHFRPFAKKIIKNFLIKSLKRIISKGIIRGRAFIKPVTDAAIKGLSSKIAARGAQAAVAQSTSKAVESIVAESVESVTVTTTKTVTEKTAEKVCSETVKKGVGKTAAAAGATSAGISVVVGGVFLCKNLKDLKKQKEKGQITEMEYEMNFRENIGEYVGDVVGSGMVGALLAIAPLTGPLGIAAAIGGGVLASFGIGKLGGLIAKKTVKARKVARYT